MSNRVHAVFDRLLGEEQAACTQIAENLLKTAYEQGMNMDAETADIGKNAQVLELIASLTFLAEAGLVTEAATRLEAVQSFI